MSHNQQVSVDALDARRIGVVDDQRDFTVSALCSYLNAYPDIVIVAAAETDSSPTAGGWSLCTR
ncbi:hypothetical protein [Nocardia salmonicida]|uniref:hypothetical protein n=1 Tax=Nocardia salmonicida TaxID=53431 RepID=UPI0033E3D860